MRYTLLLLFAGCTPAVADVDRPGIIAELATHTACILFDLPDAPTPDVPIEGCVDGCTCNGTGRERTGDWLSTVDCRCPDGCDCKAASKQETPTPIAETVNDPPLVEVAPKWNEPPIVSVPQPPTPAKSQSGRVICRGGTCYWVEEGTGRRYRVVR